MPADVRPARPQPLAPRVLAGLAALGLAAGLSGCGTHSAAAGNVITVSTGACGAGWHSARAGMRTFQVRNSSTAGAEAYLVNPARGVPGQPG
ncbi:MAG: hypothetical protein ACR2MP_05475 [Streptosporangiaceae bacterium]